MTLFVEFIVEWILKNMYKFKQLFLVLKSNMEYLIAVLGKFHF